jgi:hypothetical protein
MNLSFATVLFAAIIAALIAMPAPAPLPDQTIPTATANTDRLLSRSTDSPCAQQNWPNFDAACLRYLNGKRAPRDIRTVGDQS